MVLVCRCGGFSKFQTCAIAIIGIFILWISGVGIGILVGLEDYLLYKHSIKNKEEMIQMLNENQEEYTRIAQEAEAIFYKAKNMYWFWMTEKILMKPAYIAIFLIIFQSEF